METGYAKRGRGYGEVEILARYSLPKHPSLIRWRWKGDSSTVRLTEGSAIIPLRPLSLAEQERLNAYKELADALTHEWQSMSALCQKMKGWPGIWGMCKKLERLGKVEMQDIHHKPNCRGSHAWRTEARLKPK